MTKGRTTDDRKVTTAKRRRALVPIRVASSQIASILSSGILGSAAKSGST